MGSTMFELVGIYLPCLNSCLPIDTLHLSFLLFSTDSNCHIPTVTLYTPTETGFVSRARKMCILDDFLIHYFVKT